GLRRVLVNGGYYGRYASSGHLLYAKGNSLFAAPMDAGRMALTGPSEAVLGAVRNLPFNGIGGFAVARDGTLVFVAGSNGDALRTFAWLGSGGKLDTMRVPPGAYRGPRLSPDGQRLAFSLRKEGKTDIFVLDLGRDV